MAPVESEWALQRVLSKGGKLREFRVPDIQPIEAAKEVTGPVLVIHGENDPLIPLADAQQLYENLLSPAKQWYVARNTDHDHILQYGDVGNVNRRIVEFLQQNMLYAPNAVSSPQAITHPLN